MLTPVPISFRLRPGPFRCSDPTDVGMYTHREANSMVEEFMLLANISVATEITRAFPQCAMLRR